MGSMVPVPRPHRHAGGPRAAPVWSSTLTPPAPPSAVSDAQATIAFLFRRLELASRNAHDGATISLLAERLALELTAYLHALETVVFPDLRSRVAGMQVDLAEVENECMRELLQRWLHLGPDGSLFEARLAMLRQLFEAHRLQVRSWVLRQRANDDMGEVEAAFSVQRETALRQGLAATAVADPSRVL